MKPEQKPQSADEAREYERLGSTVLRYREDVDARLKGKPVEPLRLLSIARLSLKQITRH
jgi:hypothetical protein